ncbi:hypothetical protein [Methylobacterium pseudosasicola]|uniref:hypothetical protein n=1 Tax=Methylobacterium pseudosasicola TaxID=582667 RepID=UPI001114525B|nr:hypothetical protein [Methylobacterium pseudosasicola]
MPDPALLDLMYHLSWQPPALVRPAMVASAAGSSQTFEKFVESSEVEIDAWELRGRTLRAELWQRAHSGDTELDFATIESMVDSFERSLRPEGREVARFRKSLRREVRDARPSSRAEIERLGRRMLVTCERFLELGLDFALFLRALRAEMDPDAQGVSTFDDPDALEKFLLTNAA